MKKLELHDRINRVINAPAFEKTLEAEGFCLFDFQAEWTRYPSFENLPPPFQHAIIEAEKELSAESATLV